MLSARSRTGLVLSGGGARGAYQVGVLLGIAEVLERAPGDPPLFNVFSGTSVGAMNNAYLVGHADRGDLAVEGLAQVWEGLRLDEQLQLDLLGLLGWRRLRRPRDRLLGRSILDPSPVEALVRSVVDWSRVHDHVRAGAVDALTVAALDVGTGETTIFADIAPGVTFEPTTFPRRRTVPGPIVPEAVLASAALPILYPARRIDGRYYTDGGLRFYTPTEPALQAGATRLVVVSLLHRHDLPPPFEDYTEEYPSFSFLIGKLLNALLLDPIDWDLETLTRLDQVLATLERTLPPAELERVRQALAAEPGLPDQRIPVLAFRPSRDIGLMAAEFIREDLPGSGLGWLSRRVVRALSHSEAGQQADFASYLLLDGRFARRLIDLGRADAHRVAADVRRFFATP
jgi:NTE family protein